MTQRDSSLLTQSHFGLVVFATNIKHLHFILQAAERDGLYQLLSEETTTF